MRVYVTATLLSLLSSPAVAQNLAPAAVLDVEPTAATLGQTVRLDASRSFDPDDGPEALVFEWAFGDGETSSGAALAEHEYTAPGAYRVRVSVFDGSDRAEASATVVILAPPTATPARASSSLAADADSIFVLAAPAGELVEIDPGTGSVRRALEVCDDPRALALRRDGSEIWIACPGGSALVVVDRASWVVRSGAALPRPASALVVCPVSGRAVVGGVDTLTILSPEGEVLASVEAAGEFEALACDAEGRTVFAPAHLTRWPAVDATAYALDLDDGEASVLRLAEDRSADTASSGGGAPNQLVAAALSPAGDRLWLGGLKSNTSRGLASSGQPLTPENRVRALLAPVALPDGVERIQERIDANDAGEVSAIAFSDDGRYAYLAHSGIGAVSIYDLPLARAARGGDPGATVATVARIEVGVSSDALLVRGASLFVRVRETLELVEVDVSDPSAPREVARIRLGEDPRAPAVQRGALMFHSSRPPVHSRGGYLSCASCHPRGGHDGRTWDFTQSGEGLRNTIDLRGRGGLAHGPLHWTANFDEIQDFENDIVHGFGGEGLAGDGQPPHAPLGDDPNAGRSADLDALSAYVTALGGVPDSPRRHDVEAIARGRALFFSEDVGCARCHIPPRFTDSEIGADRLHDVGTLLDTSGSRLGTALTGLDTPTLLGVWATAPYLHDGRAPDLRAVLTTENPADEHGRTSHLDERELADLVSYVGSLDDRDALVPEQGCACGVSARGANPPLACLALGLLAWRWRRRAAVSRARMTMRGSARRRPRVPRRRWRDRTRLLVRPGCAEGATVPEW